MSKIYKMPGWRIIALILILITIMVVYVYMKWKSASCGTECIPRERWNVMIMVDASGSLKELDDRNSDLDINDTLNDFIDRLYNASQESGVKVKLGIQPFDVDVKDKAIRQYSFIDNKEESANTISINYDLDSSGTDIEKAMNYALNELKKDQDESELMRNIVILFTDGKEDKINRSMSLEEALKDELQLADKLNCELFIISPNTMKNGYEGEGDLDTIEKLSEEFRFGRMYFYNSATDCELVNYIVTKDAGLIMKMLELVAQVVSGKEVELLDKKSSRVASMDKTVACYEFDVEDSEDTIELFFQNLDKDDVDKIKVVRIDDEKEMNYRVVRTENNSVLIQLLDIEEGRYRIETKDWPGDTKEFKSAKDVELAEKLLKQEEAFERKIICLRKSKITYNVKSEQICNDTNYQGESRLADGREFNVPYLEKIVVVPMLNGEEVLDEKVLRAIDGNYPHFYIKAPDPPDGTDKVDLWKYWDNQVARSIRGVRLSYDEKEKGFVGYVPVMSEGQYEVNICMTRGNKTDIIDYSFECKSGISQTFGEAQSWKYEEDFSIHAIEAGEFILVGKELCGRDIILDKENVTYQGNTVMCVANKFAIEKTWYPWPGIYEVRGKDQFGDKWTINGTVWVLHLGIIVLVGMIIIACWISYLIFWVRGDNTYEIVINDNGERQAKDVPVPRGKYLSIYELIEHALELNMFEDKDRESVEKYVKAHKKELQWKVFVRKPKQRYAYKGDGSNSGYCKVDSVKIKITN